LLALTGLIAGTVPLTFYRLPAARRELSLTLFTTYCLRRFFRHMLFIAEKLKSVNFLLLEMFGFKKQAQKSSYCVAETKEAKVMHTEMGHEFEFMSVEM
jgi:hypothetical protein